MQYYKLHLVNIKILILFIVLYMIFYSYAVILSMTLQVLYSYVNKLRRLRNLQYIYLYINN